MLNLLNFNRTQLIEWLATLNEPRFRAFQLLQWIHQRGETDFAQMTDLSKSFRARLAEVAEIKLPEVAYDHISSDGTRKWLFRLQDNNCIETVFIPEEGRGTLCVSSQVGCALNCSFCSTGKQGFNRNLTTAEIIGQVWMAVRLLSQHQKTHDHRITNIVMMGMGEPLLNIDNLLPALSLMMDDMAYGLSKRRVTVSTSGVIPGLLALKASSDCALAVSLHAPNDELRNELVPVNKKYLLAQLMSVCRNYFNGDNRRRILMEYVMLRGVNDSLTHAKQLIRVLNDIPAKVNLIPFNPFPQTQYQCSDWESIIQFQQKVSSAGIITTIRKTRGQDIDGACGQLVGKVKLRQKRYGVGYTEASS